MMGSKSDRGGSILPPWFDATRWVPPPGWAEQSNLTRFMRRYGLTDYRELLVRARAQPEWFYPACFNDIGLDWLKPYEHLFVETQGPEWAQWFVGGQTNLAWLACDRWLTADTPAILWEGEDGSQRRLMYPHLHEAVVR